MKHQKKKRRRGKLTGEEIIYEENPIDKGWSDKTFLSQVQGMPRPSVFTDSGEIGQESHQLLQVDDHVRPPGLSAESKAPTM